MSTPMHLPRPRPAARGITLVEFVIVFPLATLFVLSLIQVGMIYMAKTTLNHATFMTARIGSLHNASESAMREALIRGLTPFYQDNTLTNDTERLARAYARSKLMNGAANPLKAELAVLNPSKQVYDDFGVKDPKTRVTYIPNDNLEWRHLTVGSTSKVHIRDANLLKIRVVYGYELKVPLIAGVLARVMCGGSIGVEAYGNVQPWDALFGVASSTCLKYYMRGLIPLESHAIVEMQSRAVQAE